MYLLVWVYDQQRGVPTVKAELRRFDSHDWMIYVGCESKNPMIGQLYLDDALADLVLDGNHIQINPKDEDDFLEGDAYFRDFPNNRSASQWARYLLGRKVTKVELANLQFEKI